MEAAWGSAKSLRHYLMVFMDDQRLCESGDVQIPHTSPYDYNMTME